MRFAIAAHLFASVVYTLLTGYYFSYLSEFKPLKRKLVLPSIIFFIISAAAYFCRYQQYIIAVANILFLLTICRLCSCQKRSLFYFAVLQAVLLYAEAITFYIFNMVAGTKLRPDQLTLTQKSIWELISIAFIVIIVVFTARRLKCMQNTEISFGYWIVYFLVPLGSIYILFYINQYSNSRYEVSLAALLVLLGINMLIVKAFNNTVNSFQTKMMHQQMVSYMEAVNQVQADLIKNKAEVDKTSHDLKNMLLPIRLALEKEDYETVSKSLDEILDKIESKDIRYTGVTYIDNMLNYKKGICSDKGIQMMVLPVIQTPVEVNYFDMSIMLGAALDNAIDACELLESPGEIVVKVISKKNLFQVIISNPYCHDINVDRNGRIVTTKTEAEKHGFGLKSIQQLIEKNSGYFDYHYDNNYFTIKMILYGDCEQHSPDGLTHTDKTKPYIHY